MLLIFIILYYVLFSSLQTALTTFFCFLYELVTMVTGYMWNSMCKVVHKCSWRSSDPVLLGHAFLIGD